jgi:hypothetical protein
MQVSTFGTKDLSRMKYLLNFAYTRAGSNVETESVLTIWKDHSLLETGNMGQTLHMAILNSPYLASLLRKHGENV